MIEYEDIFKDKFIMFKTVPLEGVRTIKEKDRKCNTCSEYNKSEKDMCIPVGLIANPDCPFCSFYRAKKVKLNNVRGYRKLK